MFNYIKLKLNKFLLLYLLTMFADIIYKIYTKIMHHLIKSNYKWEETI
jgi:hypothetical protein